MKTIVLDCDETVLVEVTNSFLEDLLADLEGSLDVVGSALVAVRSEAVMVFQPLQESVGKVAGLLPASGLERDVNLAVRADVLYVAFQAVAGMHALENLVTIDKSLIFVVNDDLEP